MSFSHPDKCIGGKERVGESKGVDGLEAEQRLFVEVRVEERKRIESSDREFQSWRFGAD